MKSQPKTKANVPRAPFTSRRVVVLINVGLALACVLVYGQVLGHSFVNYDDDQYVTGNPHVKAGFTRESVLWALSMSGRQYPQPVTWFSHMLDCTLFGLRPAGHHATNLLLHIVNTLLLFHLLRRATSSFWCGAAVALLFALHPLHVEPVAWVGERKGLLSALFWFLGLEAHGAYAKRPGAWRYAAVLACGLLGLLAKPSFVVFPFTLLLWDLWPLKRYDGGGIRRFAWLVFEKAPLFAMATLLTGLTLWGSLKMGNFELNYQTPLTGRLAMAVETTVIYLWKTIWPANLAAFYPRESVPHSGAVVAGSMAFLIAITLGTAAFVRTRPYLIVGWLFFLVGLAPVSQVIQWGYFAYADRFTYVPLIGIFIMAVYGLSETRIPKPVLACATGAIALALAVLAGIQTTYWRDSIALFTRTLCVTEKNSVAHTNLGCAFIEANRIDEALEQFQQALEIDPADVNAHRNLGYQLAKRGEWVEAIPHYSMFVAGRPRNASAHNDFGYILKRAGRTDEAIAQYRAATELKPSDPMPWNNWGTMLLELGRMDEAIQCFESALEHSPADAASAYNLGNAFTREGKLDEAEAQYRRAMANNPRDANIPNNLGMLLKKQGKYPEAESCFMQALRLDNRSVAAHVNLGQLLDQLDRKMEAAKHFKQALELKRISN